MLIWYHQELTIGVPHDGNRNGYKLSMNNINNNDDLSMSSLSTTSSSYLLFSKDPDIFEYLTINVITASSVN